MILPLAVALVAMSSTIAGPSARGTARQMGFVPTPGVRPPKYAIVGGAVDIARTARPRRGARRAEYPSARQWFELTTPTTKAPPASAPSAARSTPARAPSCPTAFL